MIKAVIAVWRGEDRILPNVGHVSQGQKFIAPEGVVHSLIEQGLAEADHPSRLTSVKKLTQED